MAHFPQPHPQRRASRVRIADVTPLTITADGSKGLKGTLVSLSITGGCAQLPGRLNEGALVEVAIQSRFGAVTGLAEMLRPHQKGASLMQPFRFVALADDDHRCLRRLLSSAS